MGNVGHTERPFGMYKPAQASPDVAYWKYEEKLNWET